MSEPDDTGCRHADAELPGVVYRPRWRDDATGFVAQFAGQDAGDDYADLDELRQIVRMMPNGDQIVIVEVPA